MTKTATRFIRATATSPIVWGGLASAGFYGLIHAGILSGQLVHRYFASHPLEYIETVFFFIGLAVLGRKLIEIPAERSAFSRSLLKSTTKTGNLTQDGNLLLARLAELPAGRQDSLFVRRLRGAIEHVRRRGSADALDEHLQTLADLDAERQHGSHALLRVIIWAIPILGFLGTVIGITLALANLAPEAIEDSLPVVMQGLFVAFDTTALALSLSIVLMFAQFFVDRAEGALLDEVDRRATAELEGCFERMPAGPDGQLAAVRKMAETILQANERLVRRQAELWQASMDAAAKRWSQMANEAGEQLQQSLADAVHEGVLPMVSMQRAMVSQAEVLRGAVEAAGEVARLEETLNRNLATLAGAKHFEQTVMGLAATIHLLNARLGEDATGSPPVKLDTQKAGTKAA